MNMKLSSRIIAGLSMAALLLVSAACKQANSVDAQKKGSTKAALSIVDAQIAQITVDGTAVTGSKGAYTVELDTSKFDGLSASNVASKVVIGAEAISGILNNDPIADVFAVTLAAKGANKIVTIDLKDGNKGKEKYSFSPVAITVTKAAVSKPALTVVDAQIAKITVDSVAVTGSNGTYTVELDTSKFDGLSASNVASKVVIGAEAISGILNNDPIADVFAVTLAAKGANKIVTIDLKDGNKGKEKYSFSPV
ncbi:MAG: hypothetical protein ACTTH7_03360, partial [Treponema sp.]